MKIRPLLISVYFLLQLWSLQTDCSLYNVLLHLKRAFIFICSSLAEKYIAREGRIK